MPVIRKQREIKLENPLPTLERVIANLKARGRTDMIKVEKIIIADPEAIIIQTTDLLHEIIVPQAIVLREAHHLQIEAIAQEDQEVAPREGEVV